MSEQQAEVCPKPTNDVFITLSDGRPRRMRYPFRELKHLKQKFGKSLIRGGIEGLDEETLPYLIWRGLVTDDPPLTLERVEDLMESWMMPTIIRQFSLAYSGIDPNAHSSQAEPAK